MFPIHGSHFNCCQAGGSITAAVRPVTDAGLLTWLLLIPTPAPPPAPPAAASAAAADLGVESEADRLPPVLARVAQHSPVLSLPQLNTHTAHTLAHNALLLLSTCLKIAFKNHERTHLLISTG